ncbi:MAG: phosphotransferase [Verrucomicrobiales bacterium]|nr:phosphotransferase [Verrucomicrobiales bacterium]
MTPQEFFKCPPGGIALGTPDHSGVDDYLRRHGVLAAGETITAISKAGDGNMNCVLRVRTPRRSLILKQSRPWVEKYPQFAAPWDRACREMEFYRRTQEVPLLAASLPRLLHGDPEARILVLSDLGDGGDYSDIYRGAPFPDTDLESIAEFLTVLHRECPAPRGPGPGLENREMRELNHAHIFRIPLQPDNGLDLDRIEPGLQAAADHLKREPPLVAAMERLGRDAYLADGPCLLHGDFFPGSLVRTPAGPRVIDPEFCFFGRPEYDVAVFSAHLILARQPADRLARFRTNYRPSSDFDDRLVTRLAGCEILRRILGYAQLPAHWPPGARGELLEQSRRMILGAGS